MAEPFTELLSDLVSRVDGALGAAFIDSYGEAVQCVAADGDEDHVKLMGAYQGIALGTSRGITSQLEAGEVDYCFTAYENAAFLVKALDHDYFLMLILSPEANVGKGIYNIRRSADAFNREM
jgi:predicted regulator of Ras-like GTPase activity (Roadblock/LC7/MglB family)